MCVYIPGCSHGFYFVENFLGKQKTIQEKWKEATRRQNSKWVPLCWDLILGEQSTQSLGIQTATTQHSGSDCLLHSTVEKTEA